MSILRNRLLRRFSVVGRLGDIAMVAGMAARLAQRKGWIGDQDVNHAGFVGDGETGGSISPVELAVAGAALFRLLRRKTRRPSR